jgi:hypothetical protein
MEQRLIDLYNAALSFGSRLSFACSFLVRHRFTFDIPRKKRSTVVCDSREEDRGITRGAMADTFECKNDTCTFLIPPRHEQCLKLVH